MSRSLYRTLNARFGRPVDRLTRRQFLRDSLAAASATMLSASLASAQGRSKTAGRARVIMVGAGFAGLSCAYELAGAGYDVTVLEARDRLGGRVRSVADLVPNKMIEAGGEFIGSNHPTWLAYADRFKLSLVDVTEHADLDSPVILDGKRLSKLTLVSVFQQMQEVFARLTEEAKPIDADAPWKAANAVALDRLSVAAWLDRQDITKLGRRAIEAQFVPYSGVPTEQESHLGMLAAVKGGGLEKYWTENEAFHCRGGNQQLAARLAEGVRAANIHAQSAVESITIDSKGATVTCASGDKYEADDVVLAIPPSTWSQIRFAPPLPEALKPQMGANVKYLAVVREAFWKDADSSPLSLSDGTIGVTWNATDGQAEGPEQGLLAFSGGPAVERLRRMESAARDATLKAELEERYPGFEKNLLRTRFFDWPGERFTRASYSMPAPGQVTTQGPLLAAGQGRLHFAGEHACLKFVGFMEGALNSGAAVARRIAVRDGVTR